MWTLVVHTLLLESHLEGRRLGSFGLLFWVSLPLLSFSHTLFLCVSCVNSCFVFYHTKKWVLFTSQISLYLNLIWSPQSKICAKSSLGMKISFSFSYFVGFPILKTFVVYRGSKDQTFSIAASYQLGTLWNKLKTHECGFGIPNIRITFRLWFHL